MRLHLGDFASTVDDGGQGFLQTGPSFTRTWTVGSSQNDLDGDDGSSEVAIELRSISPVFPAFAVNIAD